jgi:hypothetical protein
MATGYGIVVQVDTSKLDKLGKDVLALDSALQLGLIQAVADSVGIGAQESRDEAPIHRGILGSTIRVSPPVVKRDARGTIITGKYATDPSLGEYPGVMEWGRGPNQTGPPISVMEDYIRYKLAQGGFDISGYKGDTDKAIRSAAFRLSRSIGIKGTREFKYMEAGAFVMTTQVVMRIQGLVERLVAKFERG